MFTLIKVWKAVCAKPLNCKRSGKFRNEEKYLLRLSKDGKSVVAKTGSGNWVVIEKLYDTVPPRKTLEHFDIYDHFFVESYSQL